jgi:WS/DGAT/MGAT family acyltransferase
LADELLSPLDFAFWHLDAPGHPLSVGALAVFESGAPVDPEQIASLLAERAAAVARLRLRVRDVWYPAGGAVWTPDETFDATRHVRVTREPVAELMARAMDRTRPPWEVYVIEGAAVAGAAVAGGDGASRPAFSVLVKLHHALADGLRAVQVGAALLDEGAGLPPMPAAAPPARTSLIPTVPDARRLVREAGRALGIGSALVRAALDPFGPPALGSSSSGTRRLATAVLDLDELNRIRKSSGGTVNDVVMAVVAGALRRWMHDRGDDPGGPAPRALIPVARRRRRSEPGPGNRLSGYLIRLPVAEADPLARLRAVRRTMDTAKATGPDGGPGAVALLADTLPLFAHRLAAPVLGRTARLLYDVLITNVPIPDIPLSLSGHRLAELYPLAPLAHGQSLAIALSTYHGRVHVGLLADAAAIPDLDRLATCTVEALTELTAAMP